MTVRNTRVLGIFIFEEAAFVLNRKIAVQYYTYSMYEHISTTNLGYPEYLTCFKTRGEYDVWNFCYGFEFRLLQCDKNIA